jgi:hypothetical protein
MKLSTFVSIVRSESWSHQRPHFLVEPELDPELQHAAPNLLFIMSELSKMTQTMTVSSVFRSVLYQFNK